jgi:hypothetical protein
MQPRSERAIAAELPHGAVRTHECVLHEILGLGIAIRQDPNQLEHAQLVACHQFVKRFTVASRGLRHECVIYIHKGSSFGRLAASLGLDCRAADLAAMARR